MVLTKFLIFSRAPSLMRLDPSRVFLSKKVFSWLACLMFSTSFIFWASRLATLAWVLVSISMNYSLSPSIVSSPVYLASMRLKFFSSRDVKMSIKSLGESNGHLYSSSSLGSSMMSSKSLGIFKSRISSSSSESEGSGIFWLTCLPLWRATTRYLSLSVFIWAFYFAFSALRALNSLISYYFALILSLLAGLGSTSSVKFLF